MSNHYTFTVSMKAHIPGRPGDSYARRPAEARVDIPVSDIVHAFRPVREGETLSNETEGLRKFIADHLAREFSKVFADCISAEDWKPHTAMCFENLANHTQHEQK